MNWLLLFGILFSKYAISEKSRISDLRLCADPKCSEPVSEAKPLIPYNSDDPRILSFHLNTPITVYSKEAGSNKNLWGVKIGNKRGYVPKNLIREFKVHTKNLTFEVSTEDAIDNDTIASESTNDTVTNDADSVIRSQHPSEIVSDVLPSQTERLPPPSSSYQSYTGSFIRGASAEPQGDNHVPTPSIPAKSFNVIDGTTFYDDDVEIPTHATSIHSDVDSTSVVENLNKLAQDEDMTKTLNKDAFLGETDQATLEAESNRKEGPDILGFFTDLLGESSEGNDQIESKNVEVPLADTEHLSDSKHEVNHAQNLQNDSITGSSEYEATYYSRKLLEESASPDTEKPMVQDDTVESVVDDNEEEDEEDDGDISEEDEDDEDEDEEEAEDYHSDLSQELNNPADESVEEKAVNLNRELKSSEHDVVPDQVISTSVTDTPTVPVDNILSSIEETNILPTASYSPSTSTSISGDSHIVITQVDSFNAVYSDLPSAESALSNNSGETVAEQSEQYTEIEQSVKPLEGTVNDNVQKFQTATPLDENINVHGLENTAHINNADTQSINGNSVSTAEIVTDTASLEPAVGRSLEPLEEITETTVVASELQMDNTIKSENIEKQTDNVILKESPESNFETPKPLEEVKESIPVSDSISGNFEEVISETTYIPTQELVGTTAEANSELPEEAVGKTSEGHTDNTGTTAEASSELPEEAVGKTSEGHTDNTGTTAEASSELPEEAVGKTSEGHSDNTGTADLINNGVSLNDGKISEVDSTDKATELNPNSVLEHVEEVTTESVSIMDTTDIIPPTNLEPETVTLVPVQLDNEHSVQEKDISSSENVIDSSETPVVDSEHTPEESAPESPSFFDGIYEMFFGGPSTPDVTEGIIPPVDVPQVKDAALDEETLVTSMSGVKVEHVHESETARYEDTAAPSCDALSYLEYKDPKCSSIGKGIGKEPAVKGSDDKPLESTQEGTMDFLSLLFDVRPPPLEMIMYVSVTGAFVLLFTLGYYYLEKKSRDGTLISKLNSLEKELMISSKQCLLLKDELKTAKENVVSVDHSLVSNLQAELDECKASKIELEEQVTSLEKELETATEAVEEMQKMVSDLLSSQQCSDTLIKSVESLQEQLDSQQGTISVMNTNFAQKSLENEKLQSELSVANEKMQQLEEEIVKLNEHISNLSKEKSECEAAMDQNMKALETKFAEALQEKATEIAQLTQDRDCLQMTLEEVKQALAIKDSEVAVLQDCLKQLRTMEEEEEEGGDKLQALLDVGRIRAELKIAAVEKEALRDKLHGEEDARKLLEDHVKVISGEVERLRSNFEAAERDKIEAQTKLEVLSNYFKEKETQLQKELGLQEAMFSQKENDVMTTYERIKSLQDEVENYKSQNETLKKEILDQERSFKNQLSALEKKAHENWVVARQAERKLEETKQDNAQLRNRLIVVEKNLNNSFSQNGEMAKIADRLQSESNGELPTSPLHVQDSTDSPLHYREGLPVSPPLPVIGPGPPLLAPFMGIPSSFIPPPPPGVSFPPPLFPEDRRPPPLGRMSSPPPGRRYSPPSPLYDRSPPLSPPYRHTPPHFDDDDRYRHMSPPPHWDNPAYQARSSFRPLPPPNRRGSPRDSRGSALSSGQSSESLEKSGRNSKV